MVTYSTILLFYILPFQREGDRGKDRERGIEGRIKRGGQRGRTERRKERRTEKRIERRIEREEYRDRDRESRPTLDIFEERERERVRTDLPPVFFKEGRREEGGGGGGGREALASPFSRVLKQTTLVIYNILERPLFSGGGLILY